MKSPGHQQQPEHQVHEKHADGRFVALAGGEVIADSRDVIAIEEDGFPVRYYFPRDSVKADLERSATTSECPFKGHAAYFDLRAGGHKLHDAVWSYEQPYDEHKAIAGRFAFYDDKLPELDIKHFA